MTAGDAFSPPEVHPDQRYANASGSHQKQPRTAALEGAARVAGGAQGAKPQDEPSPGDEEHLESYVERPKGRLPLQAS